MKALHDVMHNAAEVHLASQPHNSTERLLVDILMDLGISEVAKQSDMVGIFIAGTHTTAMCECLNCFVCCCEVVLLPFLPHAIFYFIYIDFYRA